MNGPEPHGTHGGATLASWAEFERAAPELAAAFRSRFEANLHHVIGTIRADGSPRLSGTEVRIGDGEVTLGMMPDSKKLADVRRDPRVEIHSAPLETDLAGGDAKLAGSLSEQGSTHEPEGTSFGLRIALASLVRVEGNELVLMIWRPGRGTREIRRS
ncbi:MAG: pyridoxamine 5'-phosphate oxidase family protein [Nitriliruptorales bacterium]